MTETMAKPVLDLGDGFRKDDVMEWAKLNVYQRKAAVTHQIGTIRPDATHPHHKFEYISYQHLMRAHYAAGNRGEAVRAYQRCLESLRRDLDVDPSPATDALYREISEGKTPTTTLQRGPSNVAG